MVKAEDEDLNYSAKLRCTDDGTRELLYYEIDILKKCKDFEEGD